MADEFLNPHDRFFRHAFGLLRVAQGLLEYSLPKSLTDELDMQTIQAIDGTFVDPDLRESQSDLLFDVRLRDNRDGLIYVLFEHKSTSDRTSIFQLLKYMVRIWEKCQRDKEKLRPLLPVIVYAGRTAWTAPHRMRELVKGPEPLERFIPDFEYVLVDLTTDSEFIEVPNSFLRANLGLLKYGRRDDLLSRLPFLFGLYSRIENEAEGLASLRTAITYLLNVTATESEKLIFDAAMTTLSEKGRSEMTTIADKLRREGVEQGIEQGIEQGTVKTLRKAIVMLVEVRFPELVSKARERAEKIDRYDELERLANDCKTVESAEALADRLK